jgi:hypothetical protein
MRTNQPQEPTRARPPAPVPAPHRRLALGVGMLLLLAATACQRTPEPRPAGHRTPLAPFAPPVPSPWQDARGSLAAEPTARSINEALDQLIERSNRFAEPLADAPPGVLAEVEQLFVSMGRLGELLHLYRTRVEVEGPTSAYAPRLAVFYTRLGYLAEARALLDAALAAPPASADVETAAAIWLLEGRAPDDDARLQASLHLQRASAADPGFSGIFTYDAAWAQGTLRALPAPD